MNQIRKKIIENYIEAYNQFDIDAMLDNLDENVVFQNVSFGQMDLQTNGIQEFKHQAEEAKRLFSERTQTITSWTIKKDQITVGINYIGILAVDIPQRASVGDTLELNGKSEFQFEGDKIVSIKDIS